MEKVQEIIINVDNVVWGPAMLVLMVGTGIFLTVKTRFLTWRNLRFAIRETFRKTALDNNGEGEISSFAALTTALAATIGTGNIVGVATALATGGPGALVWMCISAVFGFALNFGECMLAVKYREIKPDGHVCGGPMYTMKKGLKNKRLGSLLACLFSVFAVLASFGIGNMTQVNSISAALRSEFNVSEEMTGIVTAALVLLIVIGGIKIISKVSSVLVPVMAVFYIVAGIAVMIINYKNMPEGIGMILRMAFSVKAVGGGLCGTITASMLSSLRYGVARGVFSNEAGMGSAAISAACASSDNPVRQGYINMTGVFWDTIVVCTITGLCIACSGVLGSTEIKSTGTYIVAGNTLNIIENNQEGDELIKVYQIQPEGDKLKLISGENQPEFSKELFSDAGIVGEWSDNAGNRYVFYEDGRYKYSEVIKGAKLTILAFKTTLGPVGGYILSIGIVLFAFATILGWEYQGERAFEYLIKSDRYNKIYRLVYVLVVYAGATMALDLVWGFSDIANALMAIPNLICLLMLSGEISKDIKEFEIIRRKQTQKRNLK